MLVRETSLQPVPFALPACLRLCVHGCPPPPPPPQVVWFSDKDHMVRIPVSVNFRAVLAPEVIDPVPTQSGFSFDYGIRTAVGSAAAVTIRSTGLQPAQVVSITPVDYYTDFYVSLERHVDYFAVGLFYGDSDASLPGLYLYRVIGDEDPVFVAGPTRMGHQKDILLEVNDLPAGNYVVFMSGGDAWYTSTAVQLHLWQLSYQDVQDNSGHMTVSPYSQVPLSPDGVGKVNLSFKDIAIPDPEEWPPTR